MSHKNKRINKSPNKGNLATVQNVAKNTTKAAPQTDLMTKIVREAYSYIIPDITRWKQAVAWAKQPKEQRRILLMQIYENTMGNLDVLSAFDLRKRRATKSKFRLLDKNGKHDKEKAKVFDSPWFRNSFLKKALEAVMYGYTLIQIEIQEGQFLNASVVDRGHVVPNIRCVIAKESDTDGVAISYDAEEYQRLLVEVGDAEDLGLLENIAKEVIFIKFMENFWMKYAEMFGMPIRVATTASTNPKVWEDIDNMLDSMSDAMWMRLPAQTDFKLFNEGGTDAFNVYERFCQRKEAQISKLILGATLINSTSNGGGGTYAQSKTHLEIADDVMEADRQMLSDIVNTQLIPLMVSWGYPLEGYVFRFDPEDKVTLKELWDITAGVIQAGYSVPAEFITEKFGIPVEQATPPNPNVKVRNFQQAFPTAADGNAGNTYMKAAAMANNANLDAHFEKMLKALYEGEITEEQLFTDFYLALSATLQASIAEGYKVTPIYNSVETLAIQHLQNNIFAFSAAKTFDQLVEMRNLLLDENDNVKPFHQFKDEVTALNIQYNKNWLKTEYNDAVASSQMASRWVQFEAEKETFPFLRYIAIQDDRTRAEHARLHNLVLPVDDSFWNNFLPPNGPNCRCSTLQESDQGRSNGMSKEEATKIANQNTLPYYKGNVGKDRMIFKDNHPYYESVPSVGVSELSAVDNYGMKQGEKVYLKKRDFPKKLSDNTDYQQFEKWVEEQQANENGDVVYPTTLMLPDGNQTQSSIRKNRLVEKLGQDWKYAHNLAKVLAEANEVYNTLLNGKLVTTYIKFFQETPIIVIVQEGKIMTIKQIEINAIDDYRVGILMHR